jgi:hypothetical protein
MMRDENEIQRAHDILVAVITKQTPAIRMDEMSRQGMHAAIDVLCWVLRHDHNSHFPDNLAKIEDAIGGRFVEGPN